MPVIGLTCFEVPAQENRSARACQSLTYVHALQRAGALPLLIPPSPDPHPLRVLLQRLDGLLLPGGGDVDPARYGEPRHEKCSEPTPARDDTELALARWAIDNRLPILGICRGLQVLNVALGGSLYQDILAQVDGGSKHDWYPDHPRTLISHAVTLAPGTHLAALAGVHSLPVNSLHHQALKEIAPGLLVTAHAPDGVVEAVEMPDHPFALAVQWHPEELAPGDPHAQRLFDALASAAAHHRANHS
ncbi:MAG: gamma-glutamyl-gamma-aminobutyrate hydrolase family protein [Anaerolineae bacterium]|nr:gamma-glutamyl-gamma-aminobutyrate hydrolase family protein [Anaerolineae bacterium]